MKIQTRNLVLCALFAALTAVFSQIAIPIEPVPINLATLSVFLAGGLLGAKYGALSQVVYVLLGAVGAPVFQGFRGGIQALAGPTGGYIIGYIFAALVTGLLLQKLGRSFLSAILSCAAGLAVCYALGTAWYVFQAQAELLPALGLCVVPFLPGDAVKILAAALLTPRVYRALSGGKKSE